MHIYETLIDSAKCLTMTSLVVIHYCILSFFFFHGKEKSKLGWVRIFCWKLNILYNLCTFFLL